MDTLEEIKALIPHRHPFLWIDRIISCDENSITTEKYIPPDLELFKGHYPGNPITPGVLLCEAVFQSGAVLMAKLNQGIATEGLVPVLTRIGGAKFKRSVYPGDTIQVVVKLKEVIANASFFKGTLKVRNKNALQVDFACAMAESIGRE